MELRAEKGTTMRAIKNPYPLEVSASEDGLSEQVGVPSDTPGAVQIGLVGNVVKSCIARPSTLKSSQLWQTLAKEGRI